MRGGGLEEGVRQEGTKDLREREREGEERSSLQLYNGIITNCYRSSKDGHRQFVL